MSEKQNPGGRRGDARTVADALGTTIVDAMRKSAGSPSKAMTDRWFDRWQKMSANGRRAAMG